MHKILAIIPARGGSKRIPRKNIKPFLGKPIIGYSVDAALQAGIFTEVMVSTDDQEIAEVARSLGAEVPFIRSKEKSNDFAGTAEVIDEVLSTYKSQGKEFDYVCCIYPTAVFIDKDILLEAYEKIKKTEAHSIFPVTKFSYPIQRSLRLSSEGFASMIWPKNYSKRSQDLESVYHDAGQFYFLDIKKFSDQKKLFMEKNHAIVRDNRFVQDIDNLDDWFLAEMKMQYLKKISSDFQKGL